MVDPCRQAIQGRRLIKATYGGPFWAGHPKAENNKGNLWWTLRASHLKAENNQGDLCWTLTDNSSKGRKIIKATYGGPLRPSHSKVKN